MIKVFKKIVFKKQKDFRKKQYKMNQVKKMRKVCKE